MDHPNSVIERTSWVRAAGGSRANFAFVTTRMILVRGVSATGSPWLAAQ